MHVHEGGNIARIARVRARARAREGGNIAPVRRQARACADAREGGNNRAQKRLAKLVRSPGTIALGIGMSTAFCGLRKHSCKRFRRYVQA
jgi:hypothetical protein